MKIVKVAVLEDGKLAIFPAADSKWYEYIYREAAGVSWNKEHCCFQSTVPREWDYQKWFTHIVSVVHTGLGIRLNLSPDTQYESPQENFQADILGANEEIQARLDKQALNKGTPPEH